MCRSLGWMTPLASTRFLLSAVGISFSAGWTNSSPAVVSVADAAGIQREIELSLRFAPPSGGIVVGALRIVVRVAHHVPEHLAKFRQPQARHPVRRVAAQADRADRGDVGMIDGGEPLQVR